MGLVDPYFSSDLGELYLGDCLEILPQLEDKSVDLVLTDPPYMISNEVIITRGRNKMKFKGPDIKHNFGEWDRFESLEDFYKFTYSWMDFVVERLRPGGMFCSYFDRDRINFMSRYLQGNGFKTKGYFADIKTNPVPQARKVKWMNGWEMIGLWQKPDGKLTYNYKLGQQADYALRPIVGNTTKEDGDRCHPTQKPISVSRLFISYWSNGGDLVLDPFVGSGFVPIACEKLGRRWIGIEISEEYCEIAKKRIEVEANQTKLFQEAQVV